MYENEFYKWFDFNHDKIKDVAPSFFNKDGSIDKNILDALSLSFYAGEENLKQQFEKTMHAYGGI